MVLEHRPDDILLEVAGDGDLLPGPLLLLSPLIPEKNSCFMIETHCHRLPALFGVPPQLKSVLGNLAAGKVGGHYENCILALQSLALDFQVTIMFQARLEY